MLAINTNAQLGFRFLTTAIMLQIASTVISLSKLYGFLRDSNINHS